VADVRFAISRHRQLLHDLVVALDEDGVPMAETWRAVGDAAWKLGLRRPGYHVVRELVRAERARRHARAATREALLGVFESLPSALLLDQRRAIERLAEARRRERLVLEQHKPPSSGRGSEHQGLGKARAPGEALEAIRLQRHGR
jgi:hypothetical protein